MTMAPAIPLRPVWRPRAAIERLILSLDNGSRGPARPGHCPASSIGPLSSPTGPCAFSPCSCCCPPLAALLIWLFASPRQLARRPQAPAQSALFRAAGAASLPALRHPVPRRASSPAITSRCLPSPARRPSPASCPAHPGSRGGQRSSLSRHFLGYLRPREPRATTEMARLCTGFFGLAIGLILMLSRSPFLLLPCLTAAWAWPLATCFAEPVYSGALWRHRFTSNAPCCCWGFCPPRSICLHGRGRRGGVDRGPGGS